MGTRRPGLSPVPTGLPTIAPLTHYVYIYIYIYIWKSISLASA